MPNRGLTYGTNLTNDGLKSFNCFTTKPMQLIYSYTPQILINYVANYVVSYVHIYKIKDGLFYLLNVRRYIVVIKHFEIVFVCNGVPESILNFNSQEKDLLS